MDNLTLRARWGLPVLLVWAGLMLCPPMSLAQSGGGAEGDELGLFLGSMLPNQIDGVTEILPVFGARYGMQTERIGVAEFAFQNTHAEGVDFTVFSASLRADLPALDQFTGSVYGGLDLSYFRPAGSEDRQTDTGLHVGAALSMRASDTLWFRTDLKFNASPGTSLGLFFGLVFKGL